jgi:hypothetical protein
MRPATCLLPHVPRACALRKFSAFRSGNGQAPAPRGTLLATARRSLAEHPCSLLAVADAPEGERHQETDAPDVGHSGRCLARQGECLRGVPMPDAEGHGFAEQGEVGRLQPARDGQFSQAFVDLAGGQQREGAAPVGEDRGPWRETVGNQRGTVSGDRTVDVLPGVRHRGEVELRLRTAILGQQFFPIGPSHEGLSAQETSPIQQAVPRACFLGGLRGCIVGEGRAAFVQPRAA